MAEYKQIALADIFVPDRLRGVEEDHALAIQASIVEHGLLNPITVRATPNRKKGAQPYTLVAGAHRHRAIELLEEAQIDCLVVEGDALEAQLIEVEENVFRNDLSALDRAVFIQSYRDIYEQQNDKVRRGNPNFSNSANLAELMEQEAANGFSRHVSERLGFSARSVERANQIARNIPKDMRDRLRGTPVADNQSQLLKLAQLPPAKRRRAAKVFDEAGGDIARTFELLADEPAAKPSPEAQLLSRLIDAWDRADRKTRKQFLDHAGLAEREA